MHAIQVSEFGGPEVLQPVEIPDPVPGDGQLLVEVSGAGVNFADTHQVENSYLSPTTLPLVPGGEVVGRIVGTQRRVAAIIPAGGYAELAVVHEGAVFDIPDEVTDAQALALLVQGLTAWHLLTTCGRMSTGESVVVHAAAGGVGNLAVQLARHLGAGRVIATASTPDKLALAARLGADAGVLLGPDDDAGRVTAALREANEGRRVDVVLEMVGGATFDGSLDALARFGRVVTYGMASRTAPRPVPPSSLMVGSKTVTGFWLADAMSAEAAPRMVGAVFTDLVRLVLDGVLAPVTGPTYPLVEARRAHEDMRARRTTGKVVLDPRAQVTS